MKNKIKITISILTIIILFVSIPGNNVFAQETTETKDIKCTEEMKPFIEDKNAEFMAYLNEHFKSKNTNTSLLDLALKRLELYKRELREKYESYAPQQGLGIYLETEETINCLMQVNNEILLMEELLKTYYQQTSNIKTTTAFMTKLQEINKKLDQLVLNVTQMLGKWNSLKDRVPCFIKKCL